MSAEYRKMLYSPDRPCVLTCPPRIRLVQIMHKCGLAINALSVPMSPELYTQTRNGLDGARKVVYRNVAAIKQQTKGVDMTKKDRAYVRWLEDVRDDPPWTVEAYSYALGLQGTTKATAVSRSTVVSQEMWIKRPTSVSVYVLQTDASSSANPIYDVFVAGTENTYYGTDLSLDMISIRQMLTSNVKTPDGIVAVRHFKIVAPNGYEYEGWMLEDSDKGGRPSLMKIYNKDAERFKPHTMPQSYVPDYLKFWRKADKAAEAEKRRQHEIDQAIYRAEDGEESPYFEL